MKRSAITSAGTGIKAATIVRRKTAIPAIIAAALLLLFSANLNAQDFRLRLNHDVYDNWKNLQNPSISNDGRWVSWEVNPQDGDGWLYLLDLRSNRLDSISRGNNAVFSPNSNYMAFYVNPPKEAVRRARLEGLSGDQLPQDSVGIYLFARSSNRRPGEAGSFMVAQEDSDWMAYMLRKRSGRRGTGESGVTGTTLFVFNPVTGEEYEFDHIDEFSLSHCGRTIAFIRTRDLPGSDGGNNGNRQVTVMVFNTETRVVNQVLDAPGRAKSIRAGHCGTRAAFLFAPAGERPAETPSVAVRGGHARITVSRSGEGGAPAAPYELWHWEEDTFAAVPVVTPATPGMPGGWSVSEHGELRFTEEKGRIIFGTAPIPGPEPEDTLLDEERTRVDIWHYRDPLIQPQQLVQEQRERERTYTAVYHPGNGAMLQLATTDMPEVTIADGGDGDTALGSSTLPYRIQNSFESGDYADIYLADVNTGERFLVLKKHRGSTHLSELGDARLSPKGKYLTWYSQADSNWHALSTAEAAAMAAAPEGSTLPRVTPHADGAANEEAGTVSPEYTIPAVDISGIIASASNTSITGGIPVPLYNELHDQPSDPGPYGIATFTEDDNRVLIYDRFDIWIADPSGNEAPVSLTNGYGRANNTRLRYTNPCPLNLPPGNRDQVMLAAFNNGNKQSGFYNVRLHRPGDPSRITMDDVRYFTPQKARDNDILIWRKSTFREFPDLWWSSMNFRRPVKISNANPQQRLYRWGEAELVEWVSYSNDNLQGILYTPDYIEEERKYPMIVYFYERLSDNLHAHHTPSPSRSTVNISYLVSNGYVVFVPDIPYTVGYPGQSAYNSIVSGTQAMVERYPFIDRSNIGIQGQSWAGYQITWLITQTDIFKAAMAGAPVTNMISAYGGIRWSTGLSRIYQYEETQSRIGGTLWEMPLRYIENSPIFFADKVNTPLLMMHNDRDGAVPWYQGIEFYMALRRLGSPVWMLVYNNEPHNLTRRPNMKDLSVRMYQFFDHYLKGEPAPVWMEEGIPAIDKGVRDGYELVE